MQIVETKRKAMLATNGNNSNLSGPARKNATVYDTMLANYITDVI